MSKHKAALDHALAALSDGSGHEMWGPGSVGQKLWELDERTAAQAFDVTGMTLVRLLGASSSGYIRLGDRQKFIADFRKLAPVLLEILEAEG